VQEATSNFGVRFGELGTKDATWIQS